MFPLRISAPRPPGNSSAPARCWPSATGNTPESLAHLLSHRPGQPALSADVAADQAAAGRTIQQRPGAP